MASISKIKELARSLRYVDLPGPHGRVVTLSGCEQAPDEVLSALGAEAPAGATFGGPETEHRQETLRRYGLLDLCYCIPAVLPAQAARGIPLLRGLGLLGPTSGEAERALRDMLGLDGGDFVGDWLSEIKRGKTHLRVFLRERQGIAPGEFLRRRRSGLGPGFWPREFVVLDACLTNLESAWTWKHFYL